MGKKSMLEIEGRELPVSNLEKVLYPGGGFTKAQVIDYYIRASEFLLPHLKDRPITLKRYPDGVNEPFFYEKNAPRHKPDWIGVAAVPRKAGGETRYVLLNDLPALVWAANLASLELHVLLARAPKLRQPTAVVFDLDPVAPADVLDCGRIALWIRDLLEALGLRSYVKSSGSKGLQLYLPLNTAASYERTKPFARAIAQLLEQKYPARAQTGMAKAQRAGKVFIDWSQNSEFKTTVCVYSLRATPERPTVSMPFAWEEVERACQGNDAAAFYLEPGAALARLDKVGDLFEPVLNLKQKLPAKFEKLLAAAAGKIDSLQKPPKKPRLRGVGDRSLEAYQAKRDFKQTAEPAPKKTARGKSRPATLRDPKTPGQPFALRLPPRNGRRAEVMGRAKGAALSPAGEAPRPAGRRSPVRLRALRRNHSKRELRRGHRHGVGHWHV